MQKKIDVKYKIGDIIVGCRCGHNIIYGQKYKVIGIKEMCYELEILDTVLTSPFGTSRSGCGGHITIAQTETENYTLKIKSRKK